MLTLLAFLIVIMGGINWLMIGMLQYDFVAGWFGYQGSIFSRLLYILVGIATLFLVFKAFADKGKINLINFNFSKKKKEKEREREAGFQKEPAYASNVEASRDFDYSDSQKHEMSGKDYSEHDFHPNPESSPKNNIFDDIH